MKVIRITGEVEPEKDIKPWRAFQSLKPTDEENVFRAGPLVLDWFKVRGISYEVIVEEDLDLDAEVTFFDSHPGFVGAAVSIPQRVKKVVDELDGQTLSLSQGLEMVQEVASGGGVELEEGGEYIRLRLGCFTWRVIRYRNISKG